MTEDILIEKIKKLPIIHKAEIKWEGLKYIPYTLHLVELEKVLELISISKIKIDDSNLCCICHKNYVDSADGYDTCQFCLNNI